MILDMNEPVRPAIIKNANHWDVRFFQLATLAASWSEDKSRQVGAVIVGQKNEVRSIGFNGFPRGVKPGPEARFSRDGGEKYYWFEHAERNALYNAASIGVATQGCSLYSTLFPCSDCVRGIIQSGITKLKTFSPPPEDRFFRRSFEVALEMASEAGLSIEFYDEALKID